MQNIYNLIGKDTKCERHESKAGNIKNLNYTNLKHNCVNIDQRFIVLNLYSISMNSILVTEFMTVKASQESKFDEKNVNTVNQQVSRYVFSKVMECSEKSILDWIHNIRKEINYKNRSNTKQIEFKIFEVWKNKVGECLER